MLIAVNYSLHLVPFLYSVFELGENSNVILGMLDCLGATIKLFVGESNVEAVSGFAEALLISSHRQSFTWLGPSLLLCS